MERGENAARTNQRTIIQDLGLPGSPQTKTREHACRSDSCCVDRKRSIGTPSSPSKPKHASGCLTTLNIPEPSASSPCSSSVPRNQKVHVAQLMLHLRLQVKAKPLSRTAWHVPCRSTHVPVELGNLPQLRPPAPQRTQGWCVFAGNTENSTVIFSLGGGAAALYTLLYTLIGFKSIIELADGCGCTSQSPLLWSSGTCCALQHEMPNMCVIYEHVMHMA